MDVARGGRGVPQTDESVLFGSRIVRMFGCANWAKR